MNKALCLGVASLFLAGAVFAEDELNPGNGSNGNGSGHAYGRGVLKGHAQSGGAGTALPITYHGGPVMLGTTTVYYIYYGNWSVDPNASTILQNFATNIGGSPYFNINTTYYDGSNNFVTNSVVYGGSFVSSYVAANPTNLTDNDIFGILKKAITDGAPVSPNAVYFILTAPGVGESSGFLTQYCGWHTAGFTGGNYLKYSFVGNATANLGVCAAQTTTSPNNDPAVDAMISVIAHELEEAVTDPLLNAWYDSSGYENADKCAWTFGTTSTASNGSAYNVTLGAFQFLIQQNWVNSGAGFCSMSYATAPDFSISSSPTSQSVNQGSTTGNYNIAIGQLNGFSSSVTLSVTGSLPAGAVPTFAPNPATTSSVLTIATLASTPTGTFPLTVSATGGGKTHTTAITLVVTKPDFSLSVSPASQSVVQGAATNNYVVTVNPVNGFAGGVGLAVTTSLPSGVTPATTPGVPGTPGTVKLTTSASTPIGSYPFTITGTSGSLTHTVQATLVVTAAGSFTITVTPSTLSVQRRGSGNYSVKVTALNGFSSNVSLSVSGIPGHTMASFSPGTVAAGGTSTLQISPAKNAPLGASTITVTGTGGGLTASGTATLTITN